MRQEVEYIYLIVRRGELSTPIALFHDRKSAEEFLLRLPLVREPNGTSQRNYVIKSYICLPDGRLLFDADEIA
jgi:hypothetical protein